MIRGTTHLLSFSLPFDVDLLSEARITILQDGLIKIDKKMSECSQEGKKLSVKLTQEETLALQEDQLVEIQLKVKTTDGNVMASQIIRKHPERILNEDVI